MASSTESLSPPSASTTSIPLETLVNHLLASKRSLSSINHVFRANELVTSTRSSLESNVITSARTEFLRSGMDSQVVILTQVHDNIEGMRLEGAEEFMAVTQSIDEADRRLKKTLDRLKKTMVEASLRPPGEEQKSLLDFVDESGVDGLLTTLEESVSAASGAHEEFEASNKAFDGDVQGVKRLLAVKKQETGDSYVDEGKRSPIPEILHNMEDRAKEMADNLESLVKHFDLCVTAIKHTEGGGDAAQRIAGDLPDGVDVTHEASDAPPEPISEEERIEMMEILEKDAGQVEDVVMEIADLISEMEVQHDRVTVHMDQLAIEHSRTISAFKMLEDSGLRLPRYIIQKQVFLMRWEHEKAKISERMDELEGLREFYDGFLRAYDNLLIEIGRRKALELKMENVVEEAMTKIEKLYEDDAEEREVFKQEQGDFLPVDIWPGLMAEPLQYEVLPVDGAAGKVPDISRSVIQQAIGRVSEKGVPHSNR